MSQKIDINKKTVTLAITLLILLILIVSPLRDKLEDLVGSREKQLKHLVDMDIKWNEDIHIRPYEKEILVVDNNNISSYNYDKTKNWERSTKDNGDILLSETGFFINNKKNNSITKMDLNGDEIWSHEIDHLAYTMIEIDGDLFVYLKVDEDNRGITVIDKSGKLILSKEVSKEEILSSNVSKNKKQIIITSMDKSSQDLKSKLTYMTSNGDVIWTEEIKDKIIYNSLFLGSDKLLLVGDKQIICINNKGERLWEKEIKPSFKDIEVIDENKIYILYSDTDSKVEVLDENGKLDYKKSFKAEYQHIDKLEEEAILIGKSRIIGINDKKTSINQAIKSQVLDIKKTNDHITMFKDNKVDIFKIIDKNQK